MNPNATPFRTKTAAPEKKRLDMRTMAINAPFAPIEALTNEQKAQQQVDSITKKITYQELLALSTSVAVAEFVLA